jgi:uncharacterized C2H2 Zn-finger protein
MITAEKMDKLCHEQRRVTKGHSYYVNIPKIWVDLVNLQCPACLKSFKYKKAFENHLLKSHPDFKVENKLESKSGTELRSRIELDLQPISKEYVCPVCSKSFKYQKGLVNHIESKHPLSENKLCPHCGKSYKYNKALEKHLLKAHQLTTIIQ